MKKSNIIKKLEKMGKIVTFEKYGYWDNVAHCEGTAIAKMTGIMNVGIQDTNFRFDDVLYCIGQYTDLSKKMGSDGNANPYYYK